MVANSVSEALLLLATLWRARKIVNCGILKGYSSRLTAGLDTAGFCRLRETLALEFVKTTSGASDLGLCL